LIIGFGGGFFLSEMGLLLVLGRAPGSLDNRANIQRSSDLAEGVLYQGFEAEETILETLRIPPWIFHHHRQLYLYLEHRLRTI